MHFYHLVLNTFATPSKMIKTLECNKARTLENVVNVFNLYCFKYQLRKDKFRTTLFSDQRIAFPDLPEKPTGTIETMEKR